MTAGIYRITNTASGTVYVGQSVAIGRRMASHRQSLKRGRHDNEHLQRAWNKYGEHAFRFEVVEVVSDLELLTAREQHWIDAHDAAGRGGYNLCPAAGSCAGFKHSAETLALRQGRPSWNKGITGYKLKPASEQRKSRISSAQLGRGNHNFGKAIPDDVKARIRASNQGSKCYLAKLDEAKVAAIKSALNAGAVGVTLARHYGVAPAQISAIRLGKTWRHVNAA